MPSARLRALLLIAASCIGMAIVGAWKFAPAPPAAVVPAHEAPALVAALARWDSGWYVGIARRGYSYEPGRQSPVAFFPAYPLLIRLLARTGLNDWVAGAALSLLCGLAAIALFSRWATKLKGDEGAALGTSLFMVYPFAFYLYGAVYSDGLFALFAIGAFYALESRRPLWAAALGAIATCARPVAPALVLGLLVRNLELRRSEGERWRARDFVPALSASGLAAYMVFLELRFGDALAFAHVQAAPGWDQSPGWATWAKLAFFDTLFPRVAPLVATRLVGHGLLAVVMLLLAIPTRRLLGWGYAVYVAAAVGIPFVGSKDFQGLGRYGLAAFPCFLTLAVLLAQRPRGQRVVVVTSLASLLALAFAYGAGGYVG